MKKLYAVLLLAIVLSLFTACGDADAPVSMDEAALKVTGNVDTEKGWSDEQVRAMDSMTADKENKDGTVEECTGISVNALLDEAGIKDGATTVTFAASDGYSADADLAEVQACTDCIVAFQDDGEGFDMVMPGFSGKLGVKDVVEIKVN